MLLLWFYICILIKVRHTFTVKNTGKKSRSFKVTHKPAGTMLTLQPVRLRAIFDLCLILTIDTIRFRAHRSPLINLFLSPLFPPASSLV